MCQGRCRMSRTRQAQCAHGCKARHSASMPICCSPRGHLPAFQRTLFIMPPPPQHFFLTRPVVCFGCLPRRMWRSGGCRDARPLLLPLQALVLIMQLLVQWFGSGVYYLWLSDVWSATYNGPWAYVARLGCPLDYSLRPTPPLLTPVGLACTVPCQLCVSCTLFHIAWSAWRLCSWLHTRSAAHTLCCLCRHSGSAACGGVCHGCRLAISRSGTHGHGCSCSLCAGVAAGAVAQSAAVVCCSCCALHPVAAVRGYHGAFVRTVMPTRCCLGAEW